MNEISIPLSELRRKQPRFAGLESGHRACLGCGQALAARLVTEAAGPDVMISNATGCLEVFTTPWPESAWRLPWMHSLFENAAAIASGMEAAMKAQGKSTKVIAMGGDGSTFDIGFQALSGMLERNHNVLYVCYDNEAYMNTGIQRSGATPPFARTNTTQAVGEHPGNLIGNGKNVPRIALAHGIPYVATASVADLHDLERKVTKAIGVRGARYIHVHVPCPLGWGSDPAHTMKVARLAVESGLFPLFEAEFGKVICSTPIRRKVPVERYLELQTRFKHLFGPPQDTEALAAIQAMADDNIAVYGLME